MGDIKSYDKVKNIGEGAFGKAILVLCKKQNVHRVIKEINISKMSPKEREEARKEVAVLSKMNHPNIVRYCDSFEDCGSLYIVMEYCDQGDLYHKINAQKGVLLPESQILDYFTQIALALKHIHDRMILHRDIKTQNIFLTSDGKLKLGDFGIAKVLNHTFDLARTCIGTPYYLSPEICESKPYNHKSDIWALGCVLYEMSTLKHAFEAGNMKNLVLKIIRGTYPPVSAKYSYELRCLISQLFRRNPRERPCITTILRKPFIARRIHQFLTESQVAEEFSHTVLHRPKSKANGSSCSSASNSSAAQGSSNVVVTGCKRAVPLLSPKPGQPALCKKSKASEISAIKKISKVRRSEPESPVPNGNAISNQCSSNNPNTELDQKRRMENCLAEFSRRRQRELFDKQRMEARHRARESGWRAILEIQPPKVGAEAIPISPPENQISITEADTPVKPVATAVTISPAIVSVAQPIVAIGKPSSAEIVADAYKNYKSELERIRGEAITRENRFQLNDREYKAHPVPMIPMDMFGSLASPRPTPAYPVEGTKAIPTSELRKQNNNNNYLGNVDLRLNDQVAKRLGSDKERIAVVDLPGTAVKRAQLVEEFLMIRREAARNRARGAGYLMGVAAALGASPRSPNNFEDPFYKRAHELKLLEEKRKKVEELRHQAEERAKLIRDHWEFKRKRESIDTDESERSTDKDQIYLVGRPPAGMQNKNISVNEIKKPIEAAVVVNETPPSISVLLKKLNETSSLNPSTPNKNNTPADIRIQSDQNSPSIPMEEEEPSVSSSFATEDDSATSSAEVISTKQCIAIRKTKSNILRRLNAKSVQARSRWDRSSVCSQSQENQSALIINHPGSGNNMTPRMWNKACVDALAKRVLESTGSSMETTLVDPKPAEISPQEIKHISPRKPVKTTDQCPARAQWIDPSQTVVRRLSEASVKSGVDDATLQAAGVSFEPDLYSQNLSTQKPSLNETESTKTIKRAWHAFLPTTTQNTGEFRPLEPIGSLRQSLTIDDDQPTPGPSGPGGPNVTLPSDCIPDEITSPKYFGSSNCQDKHARPSLIRMETYRLDNPATECLPHITSSYINDKDGLLLHQSERRGSMDTTCKYFPNQSGMDVISPSSTSFDTSGKHRVQSMLLRTGSLPDVSQLTHTCVSFCDWRFEKMNEEKPAAEPQMNMSETKVSIDSNTEAVTFGSNWSTRLQSTTDDEVELVRQSMLKIIMSTSGHTSIESGSQSVSPQVTLPLPTQMSPVKTISTNLKHRKNLSPTSIKTAQHSELNAYRIIDSNDTSLDLSKQKSRKRALSESSCVSVSEEIHSQHRAASLDSERFPQECGQLGETTLSILIESQAANTTPQSKMSYRVGDAQNSMDRPNPIYPDELSDLEYTENECDTDEELSEELEEDSEMDEVRDSQRLLNKNRLARVTEVEEDELDFTDDIDDDDDDDDEFLFTDDNDSGEENKKQSPLNKLQHSAPLLSQTKRNTILDQMSGECCLNDDDPPGETRFLHLEQMRAELEQELGVVPLLRAYNIIQALQEDEDEDVTASEKAVIGLLGEDKATRYYERILQLVLADGAFMDDA